MTLSITAVRMNDTLGTPLKSCQHIQPDVGYFSRSLLRSMSRIKGMSRQVVRVTYVSSVH